MGVDLLDLMLSQIVRLKEIRAMGVHRSNEGVVVVNRMVAVDKKKRT